MTAHVPLAQPGILCRSSQRGATAFSEWNALCSSRQGMGALKILLGTAFGALVLVLAGNAHASDAGCVAQGDPCTLADACCSPIKNSCGPFGVAGGAACGFLGCKANGSDCDLVNPQGTDPCCSAHCSAITRTCLAANDPGPACVPSGAPCMSGGGQCCNFNELCDYHGSPTTMTCGARRPPPIDCNNGGVPPNCGGGDGRGAATCVAAGASCSAGSTCCGGATCGSYGPSSSSICGHPGCVTTGAACIGSTDCCSGACTGNVCDRPSSNGVLSNSSSGRGCGCDLTGRGQPALPAAGLSILGVAALVLRSRKRRVT